MQEDVSHIKLLQMTPRQTCQTGFAKRLLLLLLLEGTPAFSPPQCGWVWYGVM